MIVMPLARMETRPRHMCTATDKVLFKYIRVECKISLASMKATY